MNLGVRGWTHTGIDPIQKGFLMDDVHTTTPRLPRSTDEFVKLPSKRLNRRDILKISGAGAIATTIAAASTLDWIPKRVGAASAAATQFSDIQFDIGAFVHPATTTNGVQVQFGVTYTYLAPTTISRTPNKVDQAVLEGALKTIEANYAFSPSGVFTFVAYGVPYFNRFPTALVDATIPRLAADNSRLVLEEAVPSPTDVSSNNPGITKETFNVSVIIETNQVLFMLRSDVLANIQDVIAWLQGSNELNGNSVKSPAFNNLFTFHTARINFVQPGLPRQMANQRNLPYATSINPASSMFMGFVDQQTAGSAPSASNVTFAGTGPNSTGTGAAVLTTAKSGDYFDNGSVIHVSHTIQDLAQFYENDSTDQEPFSERLQYMFRSTNQQGVPAMIFPEDPNDAFTNGGGNGAPTGNLATQQESAFLTNFFTGTNAQSINFDPEVTDHNKYRVGHLCALQRSSRASDGTPLHIRNDGPGFSTLDVPDGSVQPTLEFAVFVPTAEFFRVMRINSASLDFVKSGQGGGTATSVPAGDEAADGGDDGLERFLTATRRQNWLIPPRRHRSFPLVELV
jgi:hypothetical protein